MQRRIIVALLIIAVLTGGYVYLRRQPSQQDFIKKVFRDPQTLEAFLQARDATAERLHLQPEKGSSALSSYDRGGSVKVSSETARRIQELLQRASSYDWGPYEKECILNYGVLLTFHGSQQPIRIAICFDCNWLGVFKGEDDSSVHINKEMDFDPVRRDLAAVVKTIFPKDPEIQKLK